MTSKQVVHDMTGEQLEQTLEAMERHGGGFVQGLAVLTRRADLANRTILMDAFAHIYRRYMDR